MKRFLFTLLLLLQGCGPTDGCVPEAEAGHGRGHRRRAPPRYGASSAQFPLPAGAGCNGQYSDPTYFTSTSARYTSASSQWTGLGNLNTNGVTTAVWFIWFRTASSSWTAGQLFAKNSSNQRAWQIATEARGGAGEIQIAIGNGTTLFSRRIPDNTFSTEYYQPLCVGYNAGTIRAWGGRALSTIALTGADSIPATIGNSSAGAKIGANNTDAAPANFFNGHVSTVALWTGAGVSSAVASDNALADFCETLWNNGEVDNVEDLSGVQALACVHHQAIPPTEDCAGITPTGTNPSSSSEVPVDRVWSDELFSRRFLINIGNESFLAASGGGLGLYSASPSLARTSSGDLMQTYSRGVEHINGHVGQILRFNTDEGETWPVSNQPYPGQATTYSLFPHGALSGGSKRSFTLSYIGERHLTAYNETGYTMPSIATTACTVTSNSSTCNVASTTNFAIGNYIWTSGLTANVGQGNPVAITSVVLNTSITYPVTAANGPMADGVGTITRLSPERRVWEEHSDDDGANWSTPYDIPGAGTYWNSVGRGRIFQLPDGTLALPYYYRNVTAGGGSIEGRYRSGLMRSADEGETWSHYTDIAVSPDANAGMRWEEPYVLDMRSTPHGGYIAFVRADSGADPNISGGASITERLVARFTSDDAQTWTFSNVAWEGAGSHPVVFYRPSDGLVVATTQAETYPPDVYIVLRVSRDFGVTWSDPRRVNSINPSGLDGLNMQGDMILSDSNEFLYIWAQEYSVSGSPTATAMYAGLLRDCALNEMVTP